VYAKSLIVFVLCTALVIGFVVVLNGEASVVGHQVQDLPTVQTSCTAGDASCPRFSIISANLRTENTTDQLGVANPAYLSLVFNVTGDTPLASVNLYIGNSSADDVQGPFGPGLNRMVNLTLLATITLSPGDSYLLSVEGISNNGSYVVESEFVTAVIQAPYS
jgi:hypothetical protein